MPEIFNLKITVADPFALSRLDDVMSDLNASRTAKNLSSVANPEREELMSSRVRQDELSG